MYLIQTLGNISIDKCLEASDRWQLQRNLAIDRRVKVNQTSRDVQHNSMHLHTVHTKNDIDPLIFQDNKSGMKHSPSKLEWDFTGHLISNHSASGSADRRRHLGSTESKAGLLTTGQAKEIMRSSKIKQNNDRVLLQKEHTSKNLLTKRNLL
jgi:hypothetical protein